MMNASGSGWRSTARIILSAALVATSAAGATQVASSEVSAAATVREAHGRASALLPDLAANPAARDQIAAQRRLARGPFVGPPVVSGNVEIGSDGLGEQEAGVSAGLRWPGEVGAARRAADRGEEAVDATLAAARLALAGQVRTAWWALASARAVLDVESAQASVADQELAAVTRLVGAGVQARRDLLLAQGERAAIRARLSSAETNHAGARAAFEALAGPAPAGFPAELPAEAGELDEHPELRAASARAAAAEANAAALRFGTRSRLTGSVGVRRDRGGARDEYANALVVGIGVPIGRDYNAVAATAGARSQALRATAEAVLVRRRLVAERAAAEQRLAVARRAAQEARQRRDALSEALALTERGRREGELGYIETLRARQALFAASLDMAVADVAASAAISTFNQAQGVVP